MRRPITEIRLLNRSVITSPNKPSRARAVIRCFGKTAWLKDIRSVDVRQLPDWLISNYFYHEMNPIIRWLLLPFLVLLTITILALAAELLRYVGIFDVNYLLNNPLMRFLGIFGDILRIVLVVSMIFLVFYFDGQHSDSFYYS